nr:LuxR C-terminal-related transcriptional regulator [Nitrosomonas nitrosa]
MGDALKLDSSVSGIQLSRAFPFIRPKGSVQLERSYLTQTTLEPHSEIHPSLKVPFQPFPVAIFDDLTKPEMQTVLEVLHFTMQATTGADVHRLLQLVQRVVASPFVIGGVAQLNSKGAFHEFNSVINVSYSNDWLYQYGSRGYASVDPVLQSVLSTSQTQVWEQTYNTATSKKQLEFVEEARSHGLTHGMTSGLVEPARKLASFFSFSGGEPSNTSRYKRLLDYLTPHLHRILIANVNSPSSNRVKGLSPRELMVLEWMKQGKTNWEISRIIGVTERTVRFHIEGIFSKLDVGSRTQAVACAIEHGLLPNS